MKILKALLKIFSILVLALIFTALLTTTGLSYFAVTTLTQIPQGGDVNPNLKDLTRIGQSYMAELKAFEGLNAELQKHKIPPLCAALCNGSSWDNERFTNERATYLQNFYRKQKSQALQDPQFRLKLAELSFINKLFPLSVRSLLHEALESSPKKPVSKIQLTWNFERVLLSELLGLRHHLKELKEDSHKLEVLRALIKSCRSGGSQKSLQKECRETFPN